MQTQKPRTVYWLDDNLYLNITNKCSNNCFFCFRNFKKGVGGFNLKFIKEPDSETVINELDENLFSRRWKEIVFCGFGEPTSRLDMLLEVARWIRKRNPRIPIRLDTNGHAYALNKGRKVVEELKFVGLTKVGVSLNGYDDLTYNENCKPKIEKAYETTLDFVRKAKKLLEVEVSAVRMPELDIYKVGKIVDELGVPFKIREYIPCIW